MFSLYGRDGLPALQARLSRRVSRTGIGTTRWPSDGPLDLPRAGVASPADELAPAILLPAYHASEATAEPLR